MNDEQLRKFCLEQAVILFNGKSDFRGAFKTGKSASLFEIANALFRYIKQGDEIDIPFFLRKDTISYS